MITFWQGDSWFNYRVVGILLDGDRVLLQRMEKDDFWALPGGRGEMREPSPDTLRREMREELGIEVSVERLVWVVENFFEYEEKRYHELAFYYLATPELASALPHGDEPFRGLEEGVELIFHWFALNQLTTLPLPLYPSFLREGLKQLPSTTQHVVHWDEAEG